MSWEIGNRCWTRPANEPKPWVVTISIAQSRAAASLLGRAFSADPAFIWVLPEASRRAEKLTWLCERLIRLTQLSGGRVDLADDTPSAVALWVPFDRPYEEPLGLLFRAGLFATPFVLGLGAVRRLAIMGGPTKELHHAHAPIPHDYLLQLAVDPSKQGSGLGSKLLVKGLEQAAKAGRGVWLETTNPRNVAFYERHGLRVMERRSLPGGVSLVGLARTPLVARQEEGPVVR